MVISPLLLQALSSSEQGAVVGQSGVWGFQLFLQGNVSTTDSLLFRACSQSQFSGPSWSLEALLAAESSHGEFPFYLLCQASVWPAQSWGSYLEQDSTETFPALSSTCAECLHVNDTVNRDYTGDMKFHSFVFAQNG